MGLILAILGGIWVGFWSLWGPVGLIMAIFWGIWVGFWSFWAYFAGFRAELSHFSKHFGPFWGFEPGFCPFWLFSVVLGLNLGHLCGSWPRMWSGHSFSTLPTENFKKTLGQRLSEKIGELSFLKGMGITIFGYVLWG